MEKLHENILIVINPNAGKGKAYRFAEQLATELAKLNIVVGKLFLSESVQVMNAFYEENKGNPNKYSLAVIIGGDGTLGFNVSEMLKNDINIPVYAFGKGTANDFATFFRTEVSPKKAASIIKSAQLVNVDTIKVTHKSGEIVYAVNAACGGAFTNGVTHYSKKWKKSFGKLAYFVSAFFRSFTIKPQRIRFTVDGDTFEEDVFLFFVLNTRNVGGIKCAGSLAKYNDQKLDLVCVKKCGLYGKICLLFNLLFRRMHKSKRVIYRQGSDFNVEIIGEPIGNFSKTDVDGNSGGDYPLKATIGPEIKVVCNYFK
jgi:diacylglycerol kinase family enzyme